MDGHSSSPYQGALQSFIDNGINRILSSSPAVGGGDELTQRKLDIANSKLELQNAELEGFKKEVAQLKRANTEGREQLREQMEESMKSTLKEMEDREAKEKRELREQLQDAKERLSGIEGALEVKTTAEVERLAAEVKSLREQVAKDAKWRNDLALIQDSEKSNLKEQVAALTLELEGKNKMIQNLSMEMEALKQVQEAGSAKIDTLTQELDKEKRKRMELGAKLQTHAQDILLAAGNLLGGNQRRKLEPRRRNYSEMADGDGAMRKFRKFPPRRRNYSVMADGDGDMNSDAE